jgi:signal peptidase I
MKSAEKPRPSRRRRRTPAWLRVGSGVALLLGLVSMLRLLVFDIHPVKGQSMDPTLHEGEWVLIDKSAYSLRSPRYGELAVCAPPAVTDEWIKRIIGLPGDVLRAERGVLYRNGAPVQEPYLDERTPTFSAISSWDGYLLLGDNRENSSDSRLSDIGAIPREALRGHAMCVIWPPAAWRAL